METAKLKYRTYSMVQMFCIVVFTVLNNLHNLVHLVSRDYISPGTVIFNSLNLLLFAVFILHKKGKHNFANHLFFTVFVISVMTLNFLKQNLFYQNNILLAYPIMLSIVFSKKRNTFIYAVIISIYFSIYQYLFRKYTAEEFIAVLVILFFITGTVILYMVFVKNLEEKEKNSSREVFDKTLTLLASVAELKDDETHNHLERVSFIVEIILKKLQKRSKYSIILTDAYINNITKASLLHDIGKIAVDDKILLKPSRLTRAEFEIMKKHTTEGAALLDQAKHGIENRALFNTAIEIARYHHEKWNGTGYPMSLKGEEIPLPARVMAVADVYDALVSVRPYKKALSDDEALRIIKSESGTHFDPEIVKCFTKIHHKLYEKIKPLL